jgi:hypothetical protein
MIWFERKAANSFTCHWQTGALAKLTSTLVNWRSGETGALAKLALWQPVIYD